MREGHLLTTESVKDAAEWGGGHPVVGPLARTALFWQAEAGRRADVAREWRDRAIALGWTPDSERVASDAEPTDPPVTIRPENS